MTWAAQASKGDWLSVAAAADGTRLLAAESVGGLYTSTNSGVTWTQRGLGGRTVNWNDVASSADGIKLAAVVWLGRIYISPDSGAPWTPHENFRGWYSVASSADGTRLLAADNGGRLHTSTDSGNTWKLRESNRRWNCVASSADGTKLVAAVGGGQLYTSGWGLVGGFGDGSNALGEQSEHRGGEDSRDALVRVHADRQRIGAARGIANPTD